MFDASFWAFVGLLIFIGIIVYMKVPAMVTKAIDARGDKIRHELEEARRLREEAQELLADYQRKRKEAEQEAAEIVDAARREAEHLAAEAKARTEDYVERRTMLAEQKIAQAEADAVNEVRTSAVELAVAAAERLMAGKVTGAKATALFKDSLAEVKKHMN